MIPPTFDGELRSSMGMKATIAERMAPCTCLLALAAGLMACQIDTTSATDENGSTSATNASSTNAADSTDSGATDSSETESSETDTGTNPEPASVLLRVTNPEGDSVGIATITVDGVPHYTDSAGFLLFPNLDTSTFIASVTAPGHTGSSVVIELSEGLDAYDEVQLFPLGPALPLDADLGGIVEYDGVKIEFPPGSLVNRWGEYVTGEVQVTVTALDPSSESIHALPGPLEGVSALDEDVALLSLAMTEVSLWQGDMPLQLAPDTYAQLELALPPELTTNLQPGDEIPAWWLDLDEGAWHEEGMGVVAASTENPAMLVWQAEVSHFSWHNADHLAALQSFECYIITVVDEHGKPVTKGFTAVSMGNGVFVDGGYSASTADVNINSNCIYAPIDVNPLLTVWGINNLEYVITEGTGQHHGACSIGGVPNQDCTKVTVEVPAEAPPVICTPGTFQACAYSGPEGTEGVGMCQAGYDYCIDGGIAWSGCKGEWTPQPESCSTPYDDDCDGAIDDPEATDCECKVGDMVSCYGGPAGTYGVGTCDAGYRYCDPQLLEYGECIGDITPQKEDCVSGWDEDCDYLAGCTPPQLSQSITLNFSQVKQFDFSWTPALGAQYYQMLMRESAEAPFQAVGESTIGLATSLTGSLHLQLGVSYALRACNIYGCEDSAPMEISESMKEAIGYFKAPNTSPGDRFGRCVALSADGRTLATGALFEDGSSTEVNGLYDDLSPDAGAAYVYRLEQGVWQLDAYVKAFNGEPGDQMGACVALSPDGNVLVVGAAHEDSNSSDNPADNSEVAAGAAYVYRRNAMGAWMHEGYLKAHNADYADVFGGRVVTNGQVIVASTAFEDSNTTTIDGDPYNDLAPSAGAVHVFRLGNFGWTRTAYLKAPNAGAGDEFGYEISISMDGAVIAASAIYEDGPNDDIPDSGAVYVFRENQGQWEISDYIRSPNPGAADEFGISVDMSADGATLVVGAMREDSDALLVDGDMNSETSSNSGAAYIYVWDGNTWNLDAYLKAPIGGSGDELGLNVAISGDGNVVALGARLEDGALGGVNTVHDDDMLDSGAVYVFRRVQGSWVFVSKLKASSPGLADYFGDFLDLDSTGSTLAVSAPREASAALGIGGDHANNAAPGAGAVYVY